MRKNKFKQDDTSHLRVVKKNNALSIVGASRNNGPRDKYDYYPTPSNVVEELLKRESFSGLIWEPACGEGHISKVLEANGYNVHSSDIIDRGYGEQFDFFSSDFVSENIITNPPYSKALEFVLKAKEQSKNKIAMFLKTVFLESVSRNVMFQDKDFPLKTVYQFSRRVCLYKNGVEMKKSGMISYAWFVWDKEYEGKPTIEWIL